MSPDPLKVCVFSTCKVCHSNINYLVPVLEISTPHEKSWLRACGQRYFVTRECATEKFQTLNPFNFWLPVEYVENMQNIWNWLKNYSICETYKVCEVCVRLAQLARSLTANQEVPGSSPGLIERSGTLGDLLSPHRPDVLSVD